MLVVGSNIFMGCSVFDLQWPPVHAKIEVSSIVIRLSLAVLLTKFI
jgi:hypothetical protein